MFVFKSDNNSIQANQGGHTELYLGCQGRSYNLAKNQTGNHYKTYNIESVKIIDPTLQASALLAKILIRGLKPGYELWKAYIRREIALRAASHDGRRLRELIPAI
jgi:hypothetical protein